MKVMKKKKKGTPSKKEKKKKNSRIFSKSSGSKLLKIKKIIIKQNKLFTYFVT